MKVPFSKLSGCGNDFILIDNSDHALSAASPAWLTQLCNRRKGIGADGVIWLESYSHDSVRLRVYNADGGEAESCGNAFRCVLAYLKGKNHLLTSCAVHTPFTSAQVAYEQELIRTDLRDPINIQWNIPLQINSQPLLGHFLDTGVPHVVFFVDKLDCADVASMGKSLRQHPHFAPLGANINFASLEGGQLAYRTYERGVEAETHACGTGAVAVAIAAYHIYGLVPPTALTTYSGESLKVDFSTRSPNEFYHVSLVGPAKLVYEGNIEIGK